MTSTYLFSQKGAQPVKLTLSNDDDGMMGLMKRRHVTTSCHATRARGCHGQAGPVARMNEYVLNSKCGMTVCLNILHISVIF